MARVTIEKIGGMDIMLHGKIGNIVFKVRNGKQFATQKPRQRTTLPTDKEIASRKQFKLLNEAINLLSSQQWDWMRKEWIAAGGKYKNKTYHTLRGYAFARLYHEWM